VVGPPDVYLPASVFQLKENKEKIIPQKRQFFLDGIPKAYPYTCDISDLPAIEIGKNGPGVCLLQCALHLSSPDPSMPLSSSSLVPGSSELCQ